MRVANLERGVMKQLCQMLRQSCPAAQIFILRDNGGASEAREEDLYITSTKLVSCAIPGPMAASAHPCWSSCRSICMPARRTLLAAATFEDIILVTDIYRQLKAMLTDRLPTLPARKCQELFEILAKSWWPWADEIAQVRYPAHRVEE